MKKILIAILALLTLSACGKKEEAPIKPAAPDIQENPPAVSEEAAPEIPEDAQPIEIPVEMVEEVEEEYDLQKPVPAYTSARAEGLVEDTVGFVYDYPVFEELEAVNAYYENQITGLTDYAKRIVYETAMDRHTIANVTGTFTVEMEENLMVTLTVKVEFGDEEDPIEFSQAEQFDSETGCHIESE